MTQRARFFGWPHSIRARLLWLAVVSAAPGLLLTGWQRGFTRAGLLITLVAAVLALGFALWMAARVSRSINTALHETRSLTRHLNSGRALAPVPTGLAECDELGDALVDASASIQRSQTELQNRTEQAVALSRQAEERLSHHQRLEALGRLTGGVAHDFNNLLGVISNNAHLMLRRTRDPDLMASVETTLRAVESGSRLTQHLLRFAGRQSVRPGVIHPGSFLPEAAELIQALMGRRIDLSVQVEPTTPPVFADPNELELALINLALNAREAISEHGHVTLRAAPASAADAQGLPERAYVVISMTDDGRGISDVIVQRVFEPFFSTRGARQATGLGLSQVYGFCQQSGGAVRLNSTLGLGTSVSLVLPAPNATFAAHHDLSAPVLPSITGARVLLVEDHDELRDVTSALLTSFGCDVVSSASAQDALRILRNAGDIDVMLTDVLMPGPMNGVSLSRHVNKQFPGLPIVLISGHPGDVADTDEFPFLAKPYTPDMLLGALQGAMAVQRTV